MGPDERIDNDRPPPPRPILAILVGLGLVVAAMGCRGPQPAVDLESLMVGIETTGCGDAPGSQGHGILIGHGEEVGVLTVAHVVAGSDTITITDPTGTVTPAEVTALDPSADLAWLEPATVTGSLGPAPLVTAQDGDTGSIVSSDGPVGAYTVEVVTRIVIDQVRQPGTGERHGYRLDAVTAEGDSGSILISPDDDLTGILFAVSVDDEARSWAVSATEISQFLESRIPVSHRCDPDTSRLVGS